jgi:hypothetical protein
MKQKYFFLALFLFPLLAFGQTGNLTIFSESGQRFYLVLNGEQQNDAPQTNVRIEDLNQPYYSTRIIFEDQRIPDIVKNLQVTDMTGNYMDVTYKIQGAGGRVDLNYFSMAPVRQKYVAPKNVYVMHYGRHNRNDNDRDGHRDHDRYRHHDDRPQIYPMSNADFAQAKEAVRNGTFSDAQLSTAKSILANNYLTTDQVMDMCKVFSFDDSKLEFAKAAYTRTVDQGNYFNVLNVFSFSSSKEDLNNFINANGSPNTGRDKKRHDRNEPMTGDRFSVATQTIKNGSFDATKLSIAKNIIRENYFTTDQVMELCKLFSFDDSKLEIAKAAYAQTIDRNNYFKLVNLMSFSSSKDDLNNFIGSQH